MDNVNELLERLEQTPFSPAVVLSNDIIGGFQDIAKGPPSLISRLENVKSVAPYVISTARLFILLFTARRRGGNARGTSSHSLQTLSTSDSSHSLSGDRYGRTSSSLNPQQSGLISRQPQTSSSVPYIAHGSYSPYNMNGDVTDISRWDFVVEHACRLRSCIVNSHLNSSLLSLLRQWLLIANEPNGLCKRSLVPRVLREDPWERVICSWHAPSLRMRITIFTHSVSYFILFRAFIASLSCPSCLSLLFLSLRPCLFFTICVLDAEKTGVAGEIWHYFCSFSFRTKSNRFK